MEEGWLVEGPGWSGDGRSLVSSTPRLPIGLLPVVPRETACEKCLQVLSAGGTVVLCAAPGMGKTTICRQVLDEFGRGGGRGEYDDLLGLEDRHLRSTLRNIVKRVTRGNRDPVRLVVLDDIPSLDDHDVASIAAAVASLREAGCGTILSMRPEASQVLEQVPSSICLRSADLLVRPDEMGRWLGHLGDVSCEDVMRLTGGIPALVNDARHVGFGGHRADGTSLPAAEKLVRSCLRKTLMDEERELRLAMMLLGSGATEDVRRCVDRLDHDLLRELAVDEPLFGIFPSLAAFACPGALSYPAVTACEEAIREGAQGLGHVVARVARLLLERGDWQRAGFVIRCCPSVGACDDVILDWPGELIDGGEIELVRGAVGRSGALWGGTADNALVAASMIGSSEGEAMRAEDSLQAAGSIAACTKGYAQAVAMLCACRARKGLPPWTAKGPLDVDASPRDELGRLWDLHAKVRWLMAQGKVEEAYRLLLVDAMPRRDNSLAASLIRQDMDVIGALMGDVRPLGRGGGDDHPSDLVVQAGMEDFLAYHLAERNALLCVAGDECDEEQLDRAMHVATRRGDTAMQITFLLAKALADIVRGALPRAHVLSSQALEEGLGLPTRYPSAAAAAVYGLVSLCLDPSATLEGLRERAGCEEPVAGLEAILAIAGGHKVDAGRSSRTARCPAASLPLFVVATRSCGGVSGRARGVLPEEWVDEADGFAARWGASAGKGGATHAPRRVEDDVLEVRMLGGFVVKRNGEEIPATSWRRKASRMLLELLMVSPRHEASRALVSEALWPQSDLMTARNNIYAVMSVLRRAIGQVEGGPQFVTIDRGFIRMQTSHLSCDIDDFRERVASIVSSDGDDNLVVKRCVELEEGYPGNIVMPPDDPTGIFSRCHDELASLYVDAMLAGYEAALRTGRVTTAVRLARNASRGDSLREDAEEGVVRSLVAAGRAREARLHYESFARRLVTMAGTPPSTHMRRMVREMCGGGGEVKRSHIETGEYEDLQTWDDQPEAS